MAAVDIGVTLQARVRTAVYRAILRRDGQVFQTKDLREDCHWANDSPEARRMHAIIQSLKEEGIIQQSGPARRRHQYLMLTKRDVLQTRLGRAREEAGNGRVEAPPLPAGSGPQRVRYLEDRVGELELRTGEQEDKLNRILETLETLTAKVDDLHREWVTA